MVTVALRTDPTAANGREDDLSLRTIRSSSGMYKWFEEAREGTLKENPLPERIDLVIEKTRVSISDWTEERDRSVTSRQEEEREADTSASVVGFLDEDEDGFLMESANCLRESRMVESGLRRLRNGADFWDKWGVLVVVMFVGDSSLSESEEL